MRKYKSDRMLRLERYSRISGRKRRDETREKKETRLEKKERRD